VKKIKKETEVERLAREGKLDPSILQKERMYSSQYGKVRNHNEAVYDEETENSWWR
jgi:hypothetical protein